MTNHNEVTDERRTLINALVASKGWNHGYAAAFVDDYANHRTCNSSATSDAAGRQPDHPAAHIKTEQD